MKTHPLATAPEPPGSQELQRQDVDPGPSPSPPPPSALAHAGLGALLDHDVPNPFINEYQWTACRILKAVLCSICLIPLRIVFLLTSCVLIAIFAPLASLMARCCAGAQREPGDLPCAVEVTFLPLRLAMRLVLLGFGFWWIPVTDRRTAVAHRPKIVVANHCSMMDVVFMCYYFNFPSAVAKAAIAQWPVVGPFAKLLGVIFVAREDPASRQNTADAIVARAKSEKGRPLLIFPEGTTTNGRVLISFRPGPFRPGAPVQPVVLRYTHKHFNPAWRGKPGDNPFWMMLQWANRLEVTLLEQYTPSSEEIANTRQYAEGVRDAMRVVMDVPTTKHSYNDVFLAAIAERSGIQQNFEVCVHGMDGDGSVGSDSNIDVVLLCWQRKYAAISCANFHM